MTRRERVIKAVNHIQTDFVPYNISFTQQQHEKMVKYFNDPDFENKIGNHILEISCSLPQVELSAGSGYWKDEFGVVWNKNGADKDIGVIDNLLLNEPDIKSIKLPNVNSEYLRKKLSKMTKNNDNKFLMASIGFSMFERAWTMTGMENLLVYMISDPEFVDALLDKILEYNLEKINIALEYDIDCFYFGDDWGQQKGLIMGPVFWRKFIKPRVAKMYEKVKSHGKMVAQHSCGDISELFPDLIEIGLDIYQTFQPEIYEIRNVKKEFGKHLTFWGGISTQTLLPVATPDEVKRVTRETIEILGNGGGYIAAPTHAVPGDVPPENIEALVEVFQNQ